jgi:hypothetical protein
MKPQPFKVLVHDQVRDGLRRHHCKCSSFVAVPRSQDLLLRAKHLFVAAKVSGATERPAAPVKANKDRCDGTGDCAL